MATNENGVLSEIVAGETPVVEVERPISMDELGEVVDDLLVESDLVVVGESAEVVAESAKASMELLKDDSLDLDFADGLGDDPLGQFLQNEEALLNDFDPLRVADEVPVFHKSLLEVEAIKVVYAVEVVKVVQRGESTPVVERVVNEFLSVLGRLNMVNRLDLMHRGLNVMDRLYNGNMVNGGCYELNWVHLGDVVHNGNRVHGLDFVHRRNVSGGSMIRFYSAEFNYGAIFDWQR